MVNQVKMLVKKKKKSITFETSYIYKKIDNFTILCSFILSTKTSSTPTHSSIQSSYILRGESSLVLFYMLQYGSSICGQLNYSFFGQQINYSLILKKKKNPSLIKFILNDVGNSTEKSIVLFPNFSDGFPYKNLSFQSDFLT